MPVYFNTSFNRIDGQPVTDVVAECPDGQNIFRRFWGNDTDDQQLRWKFQIIEHFNS